VLRPATRIKVRRWIEAHPGLLPSLLVSSADSRGQSGVLGCWRLVAAPCWEPISPEDEQLSDRRRRVDLRAGLTAAGFDDVETQDRPDWRAAEQAMWEEAAAPDPVEPHALQSFHDEGVRSLATFSLIRRVLATASAPLVDQPAKRTSVVLLT
jgi:hypothetical protein